mmetsp:Transcript_101170/g.171183  ORF Transcript_101170/g.171183 Transcript_101170/m.171183 type:complete len:90 (+) Transcript_101170:688-957(+)
MHISQEASAQASALRTSDPMCPMKRPLAVAPQQGANGFALRTQNADTHEPAKLLFWKMSTGKFKKIKKNPHHRTAMDICSTLKVGCCPC